MTRDRAAALFVITGICASGKSTVARLLAERFERAALIHGDVLRTMVVRGREEMSPEHAPGAERALRLRHRQAAELGRSFLADGCTTMIEDVIMDDLVQVTRATGARVAHIVALVPAPAVAEERDRRRAKVAYSEHGWDAAALDAEFRARTPRIGWWLDSSRLSPQETATAILSRPEASAVDVCRL